tara:strand:+ start:673 stop:2850 length:2178 start_codon:yes stop_codon:yes gene_type:complete
MKSIDQMDYNSTAEKLVNVLCEKTENQDRHFFRIQVAYFFSKVASMMRTTIQTPDRGDIPVNMYGINLAISGYGKGMSMNIMEDSVIPGFRGRFLKETFPHVSKTNLAKIAVDRASKSGQDPDEVELPRVSNEFNNLGELAFSFDSATTAAIKQMRLKLLMSDAGSINMEIDEIGSNLLGNSDVLSTFLELFDMGKVKQKLTKNTVENQRLADIEGKTPANCLLFGTPSKVFDGGKIEEEMRSMLGTGYARRSFFGCANSPLKDMSTTVEETYNKLTNTSSADFMKKLRAHFYDLADISNFNIHLTVSKPVALLNIEYKKFCEKRAINLPEHEEILKAEMNHRYFKAMKLAGVYAFIEESLEVTEEHLYSAIRLAEDSGDALKRMLKRERPYMRIARYLAELDSPVTHVDLIEDLPCYRGSAAHRRDLLDQAIAWGYTNNILIKKSVNDGVDFLSAETLERVNPEKMRISYGTQLAHNYSNDYAKFSCFEKLTQTPGLHWINHHLYNGEKGAGHRLKENILTGCDMVVLDIDKGTTIQMAQSLLSNFTYHMHTTKRHTPDAHRFRVIIPLSHQVKLNDEDFKQFMKNIFNWLPFEVDEPTSQRERKWMTHKGQYWTNEGEPLDALLFIPKTKKEENTRRELADLSNLDNLERWFVNKTQEGDRSNKLVRYALMLVDSGADIDTVRIKTSDLNQKLADPLDQAEVNNTIMVTVARRITERAQSQTH